MSCKIVPPQKYNVVKYVDVHAKTPLTITDPNLALYLYKSQRSLSVLNGATVLECLYLSTPSVSVVYRDTAVVFVVNQPPLFKSFRIRLSSITDRILLCEGLSEFVTVKEKLPHQNNTQSPPSASSTSVSQSLTQSSSSCSQPSPSERQMKNASAQTELPCIWTLSPEELENELSYLLRDTGFQSLVRKIEKILPKLDSGPRYQSLP